MIDRLKIGDTDLHCIDPFEATFLARDVEHYFGGGVRLDPGATVLDVGANIGVFSARVLERLGGRARILAFEPLPPIALVLERNAAEVFGGRVEVFAHGLGAREETLQFTFFPLMSCLSSSRRDAGNLDAERRRVAASCVALIRDGALMPHLRVLPDEMLEALVESYLASRLRTETHPARVRPLSAVLEEVGIEAIDLLKIDVEGAELDVLEGIEPRHWGRIRQAVVEVEQFVERAPRVEAILRAAGLAVHGVQDTAMVVGDYGLLYGIR